MTHRNGLAVIDGGGEPEPRPAAELAGMDPATIDAVTRLLGQVERTARAQRPIILSPAAPAPAVPSPAPGHPGISVTIPGPPAPLAAPQDGQLPRLFTRAEVCLWSGVSVALAAVLGTAAGRSGALLLALSGVAVVLISAACVVGQAKHYRGVEVVHGRIGRPRR